MVAFSRRGRKGRREEVEKLPCPSVSAEGSFRVFSGKTAKWNPSWERRSAEGREEVPPRRRSEGAARQNHLPRSSLWPACPSSRAHPRAGGLLPRPRAPAPPATVLTRAGAARMPRPSPRSAYTSTPSGARPAPCGRPPSDHPPLRSAEPFSSPSPRPARSSPQSVVGLFGAARAAGQNE